MATEYQSGEFSADTSHTTNGSVAVGELLTHAGVKGMRWGTRKGVTSTPTPSAKTLSKPPTSKPMSDKQLKATVERLRLEQQLAQLTAKPSASNGKAFVSKLMEQQGTALIGMTVAFAAKQAFNKVQFKIDMKNAPKIAALEKARKAASVLA